MATTVWEEPTLRDIGHNIAIGGISATTWDGEECGAQGLVDPVHTKRGASRVRFAAIARNTWQACTVQASGSAMHKSQQSSIRGSSALAALSLAAAMAALPAAAATFCVGDSTGLESALQTAQANGEDDFIQLAPGTYVPSTDRFQYASSENLGLTISGGFVAAPGMPPCSLQLQGAQWTKLDGAGSKIALAVSMSGTSGSVQVDDLTIQNGVSIGFSSPVNIAGASGWTGDVTLDRVIVRNNHAAFVVAGLSSDKGIVTVRNSAFVDNASSDASGVVLALVSNHPAPGIAVVFDSNTVARNSVPATSVRAGISVSGSTGVQMTNNIVWDNGGTDVRLSQGGNAELDHNDIGSVGGNGVVTTTNAFNVDPQFAGPLDAQLAPTSPLRDVGLDPVSEDVGVWDAIGAERIVFGTIDVGAYEVQDTIFADGFE